MKLFLCLGAWVASIAIADTPPPNTVKAKMYSGDGSTSITATGGGALNVNLAGSSTVTANQGTAGNAAWLVDVTTSALPANACKETGGNLATIVSELASPLSVTGTFWQTTQPVSVASLPLPSGAATAALQSTINTTLGSPFQAGGSIGNSSFGISGNLPAFAATPTFNLGTLNGAATASNQTTQITSLASIVTNTATINTTLGSPFQAGGSIGNSSFGISGTLPAYASTPTFNLGTLNGAATASNQATIISSLSSIDTKTPALGQALAAGSVPVVLTASQLSTLTPLSSVTVSGTVTANAGSGTFTVDGSGHTQPISAAALPLPSGASTSAKQPALGTAGSASADVITVQGIASMTALKTDSSAVTQPVSGTVTVNIGNSGSLALDNSVTGLQVSQASTTSGQKGGLILGAVTTSAPTYTTAQSNPLSLTTAGSLRVDASATTQPVSLSVLPALTAGSSIIGKVGIDQTTPGTTNGVQVNAALPAGTNVIGHVIVDTVPTTAVSQSGTWTVNSKSTTPTAVTVKQAAITIGTSAVRLTNDGSAPPSTRVLLVAQLLSSSTANCYFGSSGVTTSSTTRGVQMFAGQVFSFTNDAGDYYAICDTSSQTFLITEQE